MEDYGWGALGDDGTGGVSEKDAGGDCADQHGVETDLPGWNRLGVTATVQGRLSGAAGWVGEGYGPGLLADVGEGRGPGAAFHVDYPCAFSEGG